jgi:hypothetical protein
MSSKSKYPLMDWESINIYLTKNSEYKDQSRKLLTQELGFSPSLVASMSCEIGIRGELKRFEQGIISKKELKRQIHNQAILIRKGIIEDVPEQAHLFDPKEAEKPLIPKSD